MFQELSIFSIIIKTLYREQKGLKVRDRFETNLTNLFIKTNLKEKHEKLLSSLLLSVGTLDVDVQ